MLSEARISPDTQVPGRRFLFAWNGTPCFPCGELVALTGKAKSGKTYVCSMLMALSVRERILGLTRNTREGAATEQSPSSAGNAQMKVLWIDTEQSEDSTHEILTSRIASLIGRMPDNEQFVAYNLRRFDWQDRLSLVTHAIALHKPELVIFDGIRDVVGDINDYRQAQDVLSRMLSLASWSGACIVCVLHQNKAVEDRTLRGALGTELQNKAFETYECTKDPDTRLFTLRQTATRKYDITSRLVFAVNADGLPSDIAPVPADKEQDTPCPADGSPASGPLPTRADALMALNQILAGKRQLTWQQLKDELVARLGTVSHLFAGQVLRLAYANRLMVRLFRSGVVCYAANADGRNPERIRSIVFSGTLAAEEQPSLPFADPP